MARGGGGGGHSGGSFGGSHSGGSLGGGGRSSSFGGGRSSSFGGGFSSGPSHHSSYYGGSRGSYYGRPTPPPPPPGPGYYGRPPRRVYHGSRSSSPCSCIFAFLIVAMVLLGGLFTAIGDSLGSNGTTRSTEKREKMDTSSTTYSNTWFIDELGWLGRGSELRDGLESFYKKTGVQPLVYLAEYKSDYDFNNYDYMFAKAEALYKELFGSDEGHLLFVYYACENDYPSLMDGMAYYVCGKQTEVVMDENAKDILKSSYDHYYYGDTSISVEEMLAKTFTRAGKEIMRGPIRIRYVVIIVVSVVGVIVVISLLFKWWKARKAQKNKEAEDLEKILSKPLDTFGKSDVDDLKDKYKD